MHMTAGALGEERPTLFLRKATGLVRGWSVRDSLIYACLATNFVTLGIYEFTFAGPAFPQGQFITAVIIGGIWVSFLVIAYAGLVVTIPRAGGDYVWQTRILGSGIGFVMAATGWWFILWLWAPIYGNILAVQLFEPLWATLKWTWPGGGYAWFGTHNGIFVVTLITIALAGLLVSIGMAGYAKVQRWCFIGGVIGFAVVVILLLINSHADFVAAFNREGQNLFGVKNAYTATNAAAVKAGYTTSPIGFGPLGPTMLLIPAFMFFLLWPNWGTTLFLSSTRVIFAAAFDRVLPDRAAEVSEKRRVPFYSLILMLLPAVGLAALYAYNTDFHTYTLDATLVIAVTYLFSAIAVVILPLRKPDLWFASPASKVKLFGVPIVPVAGVITIALLVYCLIEWLSNDLYFVNNVSSLVYMGANYALAIVIFVGARIIRNRQGIDLSLINKEIPVE